MHSFSSYLNSVEQLTELNGLRSWIDVQLLAFPVVEKRILIHFVENTVQLNHNDENIKWKDRMEDCE